MEARKKRFEDLNITRDEINNIGKALQKEEFRKLFAEYCEEVTNPESKKQYQQEVTELEKQRGVDVTFINPEAGFVVKSSIDGERKAFINICKNDKVSRPSSTAASEKGSQGRRWSLPFSLAPPREDYDKARNHCTVFDVVFHPETLQLAEKSIEFRKMVINTAIDAVEDNCKAKLDRANLKYPKMTYKGLPQAAVIRKKIPNHQSTEEELEFMDQIPYPTEDNSWCQVGKGKVSTGKKEEPLAYTIPKYSIKYRHGIDLSDYTNDMSARLNATVPKALIICIDLPLLKAAKDLTLDVTHKSLSLQCEKPKYKLDLVLPYGVDENAGNANFDVSTRKLSLELPVKYNGPSLIDVGREDSGVESDPGGRADDDSDEKSPSENSYGGSDTSDHPLVQEVATIVTDSSQTEGDGVPHTSGSLSSDVGHILPNFSLNTFDSMVAVVLQVKNVESNSISQRILPDGHGIQLSFSSLGGGLFPQSYAFCMAFPSQLFVEHDSLNVEAWDNNVVAQFSLTPDSILISEVLVGTGPHDLQVCDVSSLTVIEQKVAELKDSTDRAASRSPLVEVHKAEENELILKVEPYTSPEGALEKNSSESGSKIPVASANRGIAEGDQKKVERGRKNVVRQLSECSSDDLNGKQIRGILKKRPSRSLSESNVDDYFLYRSASLSDDPESGANSVMGSVSCIAEGESETGCETENDGGDRHSKKTVRFNDVVAQQTFRPNSSILGQRKKNQRKQRNKKRAQERRASESENSEPESEHDKARRRAFHSEGEASDFEENNDGKKKFLKDLKPEQGQPQAKKILRRVNSSESDEEVRDGTLKDAAGDTKSKVEDHGNALPPLVTHGESSEDERDDKTDDSDKKKKKKKRKGKKVSENGDGCKIVTMAGDTDFKNSLILDLEV